MKPFNIQIKGMKIFMFFYPIFNGYIVLIVIWINYFCSDP